MKITGIARKGAGVRFNKSASGSCHRLTGARADSPEFTQEHCAYLISSCLNRPIVGPTPPKLPGLASNLRHHRFCLFSQVR